MDWVLVSKKKAGMEEVLRSNLKKKTDSEKGMSSSVKE